MTLNTKVKLPAAAHHTKMYLCTHMYVHIRICIYVHV